MQRLRLSGAVGVVAVVALFAGTVPSTARTSGPPEVARPFEPRPLTERLYGGDPDEDPNVQRAWFKASNEEKGAVELFVETWLPAARDGHVPPARVPTVLSIQPYTPVGVVSGDHIATVENLVTRGYAYAQAHVRGSHGSGGCWDRNGRLDRSDVGDMIQFVAAQPWSDGNVGLYGISNSGASAITAAGLAGDELSREKTTALKAVVAGAPVTSLYEGFASGGVPMVYPMTAAVTESTVTWSVNGSVSTPANRPVERHSCRPDQLVDNTPDDGSVTDFTIERELRKAAADITVPVLLTQGFPDPQVDSRSQVGLFDKIPATTPKVGLFGLFAHEWPDGDGWKDLDAGRTEPIDQKWDTRPDLTRADWQAMVLAWFDRYLKGIDSGVEEWPRVQIQDTDGQWRAQDDWPSAAGPAGQLALGPGGELGATAPTGNTSYVEAAYRNSRLDSDGGYPPGAAARFEMTVGGRLELTGQPMADLWVELDRPDAHIAVTLEFYDAAGDPIPYASTSGFRSAQHLDPYVDGRFEQREPRLPPFGIGALGVGEPVHVVVPLEPRDIVVPAGGKLVLTVAGSAPFRSYQGLDQYTGQDDGLRYPSQLSGSATRVTILHGCDKVSALRFQMPSLRRQLLNVAKDSEIDEPLHAFAVPEQGSDGAGAASAPVCGKTAPPMTAVRP